MRRFSAVAMLAFALTGCGTNMNFALPKEIGGPVPLEVYGGVVFTAKAVKLNAEADGVPAKLVAAALVLDLPLSVVGDTLTLPITVSVTVARAINAHYNPPKPEPVPAPPEPDPVPEPFNKFDQPSHLTPARIHGEIL